MERAERRRWGNALNMQLTRQNLLEERRRGKEKEVEMEMVVSVSDKPERPLSSSE